MRRGIAARALAGLALAVSVFAATNPASAAPDNDDFAAAMAIPGVPFDLDMDTTDAGLQVGEPVPSCMDTIGASVWFSIALDETTRLDVNTIGSKFNTVLAVYRGNDLGNLTEVACNDNRSSGIEGILSELFFKADAGATYYVQVAGAGGRSGALRLGVELQSPEPPPCVGCPVLLNYAAPGKYAAYRAGEISIGVNPKTDNAMFLMLTHTMRVSWDDATNPPEATWVEASSIVTNKNTSDPILWTDPATGRTFVVQLQVVGAQGGSLIAYTDDDGATWVPTQPASVPPAWDHQTLGGGPYPAGIDNPVYESQLFYCAQLGVAECARSDDGGLTWGPPMAMNLTNCGGLHGHVLAGPDGTVYVPNKGCGDEQAVIVSETMGATWETRKVPGTRPARSDPKVAFDKAGRMYFVASSNGKPVASVSDDRGKTWTTPIDVGAEYSIRNTEFPMVIAGDAGRAAFAFYGTTTGGDDQSDAFQGEWHVFVSYTYDGGATWQTVDVTPNDPVQRGCIWMQGGSNPCRNLLDFQDMTVDSHGRVLVGYADGCTSTGCIGPNGLPGDSRESLGVIARQNGGKGLIAAYDSPA